MSVKEQLDKEKLPRHVAIIMDGNGRWAKKRGNARVFGHKNGVKAVREVTEAGAELGLKYLTLYAFSTENWNRPKNEVDALMSLLVSTIASETKTLMDNNVKLNFIGCKETLPSGVQDKLTACIEKTKDNDGLTLVLALSYSSRWEIIEGVKKVATDAIEGKIDPSQINADLFGQYLETSEMPDPELLIRTSGELRISNFLLWQIAYSELYFCNVLWPDFRKEHFFEAILDYQSRERRFGKISDQVKK
ncbi:isoprenyl transferase [Marinilabilia rubra]|uniref:Isoprenyl transferase n=1 Tax=Marinilabilia rubra TaxID=2162893 RepID=A0A2U2B9X3_9BACT|nr:isoprenyl transferase [Marinilabilia rubra]PWD99836.1 isoprenyl transferase [Marinilabilia rubra]